MRQQYILFQVQMCVCEGVATFPYPLPCGLVKVYPSHGWVALEPTFCSPENGPKHQLENLIGQLDLLFSLYGKGEQPCEELQQAADLLISASMLLREEKEEETAGPNCSLDRGKEAYSRHQQNTLPRLLSDGCSVKIRLIGYRQDEVLQETNKPCGVNIFTGSLSEMFPSLSDGKQLTTTHP